MSAQHSKGQCRNSKIFTPLLLVINVDQNLFFPETRFAYIILELEFTVCISKLSKTMTTKVELCVLTEAENIPVFPSDIIWMFFSASQENILAIERRGSFLVPAFFRSYNCLQKFLFISCSKINISDL